MQTAELRKSSLPLLQKDALVTSKRMTSWRQAQANKSTYRWHAINPRPRGSAYALLCQEGSYDRNVKARREKLWHLHHLVIEVAHASPLEEEFNERADRWEKQTAIHSSPGAKYLHRDYIAIISEGRARKNVFVPLILNRLSVRGGDWFFALENISDENPAKDCEDYERAFEAWVIWARKRGLMTDNAVLTA